VDGQPRRDRWRRNGRGIRGFTSKMREREEEEEEWSLEINLARIQGVMT